MIIYANQCGVRVLQQYNINVVALFNGRAIEDRAIGNSCSFLYEDSGRCFRHSFIVLFNVSGSIQD